ncbi:hypothetical protein [Melghirimyces algeriensis]|uniref:Uncharacterized protein n=1 Tax=Melghirimyces algeriensis TaxID=910412 RepID=A0A521DJ69_9BACL|nr:hypothetical protein [Melghirimyces algeriensis]SMO71794.1 hypothetical protein SAMN06264849_10690 [Melghirimyces algeriensis]
MHPLYAMFMILLAASALLLGGLDASGVIRLKTVYLFIYALAVLIPILFRFGGKTGKGSQVMTLFLLFLIFAFIPYGWEQWNLIHKLVDRYVSAIVMTVLGMVLFVWVRDGENKHSG